MKYDIRGAFAEALTSFMEKNDKAVLLLGDIGMFTFKDAFERFPTRCFNVGIREQAMVSMAAGMAREGFLPVVYTIEPFLVLRALEQITVGFGYQQLRGIFVGVGGNHDYAALGRTHECRQAMEVMSTVPGIQLLAPGFQTNMHELLSAVEDWHGPTYIRLTECDKGITQAEAKEKYSKNVVSDVAIVCDGASWQRAIKFCAGRGYPCFTSDRVFPFSAAHQWIMQWMGVTQNPRILTIESYSGAILAKAIRQVYGPRLMRVLCCTPGDISEYGSREDYETSQDDLVAAVEHLNAVR